MTGRVVLPTFGNKSRKTTKSEPSTGDTFWESRETAKFDTPFGVLGRVPSTGCNYDPLEETNWPCASSCQLLETNRGKRQSPTRLRGISWGSGVPTPGPVVCAEAWSRSEARQPVACRSPARSCAPKHFRRSRSEVRPAAGNGAPRPGPARPAEGEM